MTTLHNAVLDLLAQHFNEVKSASLTMRADGSWYITVETKLPTTPAPQTEEKLDWQTAEPLVERQVEIDPYVNEAPAPRTTGRSDE